MYFTEQKTVDAQSSSGESAKTSRPFLQRFPCRRNKRRTAKVAPTSVTQCQPSVRTGNGSRVLGNQKLTLYDLEEDEQSFTRPTKLYPRRNVTKNGQVLEASRLQEKLNGCEIIQEKEAEETSGGK